MGMGEFARIPGSGRPCIPRIIDKLTTKNFLREFDSNFEVSCLVPKITEGRSETSSNSQFSGKNDEEFPRQADGEA
jgi:hypothetical protein